MKLFDHQQELLDKTRQALAAGAQAPLIYGPTGVGKTVLAGEIARLTRAKGGRVMFIVDTLELVDQTIVTFERFGLRVGVMQANHRLTRPDAPVQVATIQTLRARWADYMIGGAPALVMIDEAHVLHKQHIAIVNECKQKGIPVLGLSATPFRGALGLTFDELVVGPTTESLTEKGFLAPARCFAPSIPSMKGIRTRGGDFAEDDLAALMGDHKLIGGVVDHWQKYASDRRTLVFACNVAHSRALAEQFQAAGVRAAHIDGYEKDRMVRAETIRAYRAGEIQVLCNVAILTKGFDAPETDALVLARPTKSLSLHLQICGRGLRTANGKDDCLILDHSGNLIRNGLPTDPIPMELSKKKSTTTDRGKERKEIKEKVCSACGSVRTKPKCDVCGHEAKFVQDVESASGNLVEFSSGAEARAMREMRTKVYQELCWWGEKQGYKPGWAAHQFHKKFKVWPTPSMKGADPLEPSKETMGWIKSRQVAYFHARKKWGYGK